MSASAGQTPGWRDLSQRTVTRALDHDALGLAAQLGFYFFLAVFPALLFLLALASFFPLDRFTDNVSQAMEGLAPPEMTALLAQQMSEISQGRNVGLLSIGLLGALWSSSAALVAVIAALNRVYSVDESRPWWKARVVAIALTVGLAFFVLVSFTLVLAGPQIARGIADMAGLGAAFTIVWNILQWPVAFALVVLAVGLVYKFAPNTTLQWRQVLPGAIVATVLWLVASLGFRFYVVNFGDYNATYGAIGGVVLLMLWFYLTGLALIAGAELNAEIGRASEADTAAAAVPAGTWATDRGARVERAPAAAATPATVHFANGTARERPGIAERAFGMLVWLIWPRVRT